MKASLIALAAIVLVSVGAYFAIASVNSHDNAPVANKPVAQAPAPAAVAEPEPVAQEEEVAVVAFAQANDQTELLAAVDTTAPRSYQPAPRVTNTRAAAKPAAVKQVAAAQAAAPEAVVVDAKEDTNVIVNGVTVFVPQGQKVTMREATNGAVVISGEDWQGVKIGNQTLNSNGSTAVVLRGEDQPIQILRGDVTATNNGVTTHATAGQVVPAPSAQAQAPVAKQAAAQTQTQKAADTKSTAKKSSSTQAAADNGAMINDTISADIPTNAAQEQTAQDTQEQDAECELSPSNPACI